MAHKKSKITFFIPKSLKDDLSRKIIDEGYGFRGKSRWVTESIEALLQLKDFTELVFINDTMSGFEITETIVASPEIKRKLDEAVVSVRKEYPALEGVQSNIVRTAILQRLLGRYFSGHRNMA